MFSKGVRRVEGGEGEIFSLPKAHTKNWQDCDTVIAPPGPL